MLDKLTVQNLCRNPHWIEDPSPHVLKKEKKKCMQDMVCYNFVLSAIQSEVSPLLCLLCLSWWPCTPGRVGAFTLYLLIIVAMLGEEVPTSQWGRCEMMLGPKLQKGQGGSISVPPCIGGTL